MIFVTVRIVRSRYDIIIVIVNRIVLTVTKRNIISMVIIYVIMNLIICSVTISKITSVIFIEGRTSM